jgi:hypothetical protein
MILHFINSSVPLPITPIFVFLDVHVGQTYDPTILTSLNFDLLVVSS